MQEKANRVLVPLADGFEEVEAVTIIDLLRRAGLRVVTAHVTPESIVKGAHGIGIRADTSLNEVVNQDFAAVVLPGGMPGTTNLGKSQELKGILERHHAKSAYLAAICAAPTVLAELGLLRGKNATCYPGFESKLAGANFKADAVVEDGNILTSRGPGTALDFALKLVEKLAGVGKSREVAAGVLAV